MPDPPRPDPARGLFETLLVAAGAPVELDAHLARLAAGLEALFGAGLPDEVELLVGERARGLRLGRLRVTVAPGEAGLGTALAAQAIDAAIVFPAPDRAAALASLNTPGGLGAHKWADRRPLDGVPAGTVPLLLDAGGEVLEAGRASVFAVLDGALVTPPADGRSLPGIARAGAIAVAREAGLEVLEQPLARTRLLGAEEAFLTGSVRGVEPAATLDGTRLPPPGEISRLVAAGLRRRWRL